MRFIEAAGNFKKEELEHLSKMLHPLECQHILAAINKLSDENGNSLRSRNHIRFHRDYPTRSNCLTGLKKWVHEISGELHTTFFHVKFTVKYTIYFQAKGRRRIEVKVD